MSHHTQCSSTDVRHPGVLPEPNDCRRSLGGLRPDSTARPGQLTYYIQTWWSVNLLHRNMVVS